MDEYVDGHNSKSMQEAKKSVMIGIIKSNVYRNSNGKVAHSVAFLHHYNQWFLFIDLQSDRDTFVFEAWPYSTNQSTFIPLYLRETLALHLPFNCIFNVAHQCILCLMCNEQIEQSLQSKTDFASEMITFCSQIEHIQDINELKNAFKQLAKVDTDLYQKSKAKWKAIFKYIEDCITLFQ